jgi:hypothetical protein
MDTTANSEYFKNSRSRKLASHVVADDLVCLNFKVPIRIRQQFKVAAIRHNLTMTELLLKLVEEFIKSSEDSGSNKELKK